ncbi:uncharacterized protein LOC119445191 isoform X4 [Dermacentor silvarum]|uniref:uncharacterized protein LOC119445191 isoform X2 n=1 Tax=Dermacentor silvarum TaxID=543639 RepID=UPI002100FB9E|nr:uncharacterized protein LOC119445191 isoform X2 [Dermacentor silvarum]XP_049520210.1 uncharacterized protein LOC119445191 isoform X3 [Dermacentor silvarum]XP_049520211.1 uncharacterized protein LOC119445191 isoform X4 [Dermacentor silvarum]
MNRNTIVSLCYGCAALNSFSFLKYAFGFYRRSIAYGWAFDLTFGSECFINLISDYLLLATYKDFPLPSLLLGKESLVLLGFIAWNSAGISICYISSIVLAVHFANTVDLKEAMQDLKDQNVEEGDFRRQMMITTISVFTLMAFMKGAILYNMYMYYKKTDGVDGSIEEAPTAYYFPADPTAPVPFLPPESKRHTRANVGGAPPAAARCGLTGAPDTAMASARRPPAPAAVLPSVRRPPVQQPFEVAVLRTPFMVLHMPPAELPTGPQPTTQQQPPPTSMQTAAR